MANDKKDQAKQQLESKFPARYQVQSSKNLNALVDALAEGDAFVASQIEAVRDNLLVITATGKYLDRLASIYGIIRGVGTGVQDDDFKRLIPVLGNSKKQISHSLQAIVDVIYGPYASHANTTCSAPGPYSLKEGWRLKIRVDDKTIEVVFKNEDAANLYSATAEEVATAISQKTNGRVIGSVISNTRTGEDFVNIRTSTIGSQGFIQVLGGEAQAALRFPEVRPTRQDIATWDVTRYLGTDEMVYTATSGVSPGMRTAAVKRGDYVTIRQDSLFNLVNSGTFEVTFAEENSFRVRNGAGIPESGITQLNIDDFTFYRPDLGNILLSTRPATVLQTAAKELTVILPVTSPIVKRTLKGGHHFHAGAANVASVTSNTMSLGTTSGFPTSGSALIVSSRASNEGVCSSVGAGIINLVDAENWPTSGAVYSPVTQAFYYYSARSGNTLTGVSPSPPVELAGSAMKYSARFMYTGITGNTLTGVYPDPAPALGLDVTSSVQLEGDFVGSFLYDQSALFVCAQEKSNLGETISQGSSRTVIQINDVSDFPEKGYFVLEFATKEQEGPIRYLGKVGTGALIIDPGHVFERDHLKGTSIRLVRDVGPYIPRTAGDDLAVYLTGTSQARSLVAQYLADIIAAGVTLKFVIQVPDQKWPVIPLLHSSNPLDTELATFE